jgi:hypothetical protein
MKISWPTSLVRGLCHIFFPILVYSYLDDDSEDENPPPPTHLPLDESIEHEPAPIPPFFNWVHSTREATSDIFGDPLDQCRTRSKF